MSDEPKNETVSLLLASNYEDAELPVIAVHLRKLQACFDSLFPVYKRHKEDADKLRWTIGKYLCVVKDKHFAGKGRGWLDWLEADGPCPKRDAQNYMNLNRSVKRLEDLVDVERVSDHYASKNPKWKNRFRRNDSDEFQTPAYALAPLLPYLPRAWKYWEPACGKGYIVQAMRKAGYRIRGTDVLKGRDFLSDAPPTAFDCIVTNPPFSFISEFLARCIELAKPFALLLPHYVLEGPERQALWKGRDVVVLYPDKRINFEHPKAIKQTAPFVTCWFCSGLDIKGCDMRVRFVPLQPEAKQLSKAS